MKALYEIFMFLLVSAFSILSTIFILRILLHLFRANANNAVCQMIAKLTNPIVLPLRNIIPKTAYFDFTSLVILLVIELLKYEVVSLIQTGQFFSPFWLVVLIPFDIVMQVCWILFYILLFKIILSWVAPHLHTPVIEFLHILGEPPARLGRKLISSVGGFDLGPFVALVVLKVIQLAITAYIPAGYFF